MKKLLVLILSLTSFSTFALAVTGAGAVGVSTSGMSSGDWIPKEAAQVLNDAQDFNSTGSMSVLLESKLKALMMNSDLSVAEALDVIVEEAAAVL